MDNFSKVKVVVFDLDGTLTETKSNLAPDMAQTLISLLNKKKVAVISGGTFAQFKKQFVSELHAPKSLLSNLFLFPTTATSFYSYRNGWKKVYAIKLSKKGKAKIRRAFKEVLQEIHYIPPRKTYGKVIEDRGSQVTFSALGQDVVAMLGPKGIRLKEEWTRKNAPLKLKIVKLIARRLPEFEVHAGGFTSIDVTKKGIDKEYGMKQIRKSLRVPFKNMIFVGDAIYPGGNDYAVVRTGVKFVQVSGPIETKKLIKKILAN